MRRSKPENFEVERPSQLGLSRTRRHVDTLFPRQNAKSRISTTVNGRPEKYRCMFNAILMCRSAKINRAQRDIYIEGTAQAFISSGANRPALYHFQLMAI